jgi:hypothetical protein
VLYGLSVHYLGRVQLQTAFQLGEQMLRLAQAQPEPALLLNAHHQLGHVLFYRGEPALVYTHLKQALDINIPQEHQALAAHQGVTSQSWLALGLWQLGYPDQALQRSQMARALAQEAHPRQQPQLARSTSSSSTDGP